MPKRQPNLLFVFADQLRPQSCGYMGDPRAHTPRLDRMAAEGMNFRQATSVHPVCGPYRAALFTGCYPSTNGYVMNEIGMRTDLPSLAGALNRAGYDSAYIGKWHLYASDPKREDDIPGFHRNPANQFVPPGPDRLGFDHYWAAYNFNHNYYQGFYYRDAPESIPIEGYDPDAMTDLALDYLADRKDRDRPFNLFLSYGPPHQPWGENNVPPEWLARFADTSFELPENYRDGHARYNSPAKDEAWWRNNVPAKLPQWMRVYYAQTANLDWNMGRLLDRLDELGLSEDTLVVFTSDHGEMFGAQGWLGKNIFYEESIRVPLLLRQPGVIPEGAVSDACINTPDLMPTLLGLCGAETPGSVEGNDLSAVARGEAGPAPDAAFFQCMGAPVRWMDGWEWRALRDQRHTYAMEDARNPREHLFDNLADPLQMNDLAGDPAHAETLARLRAATRARMDALGDAFHPLTWYREHWLENGKVVRGAKG